ncbi:Ent-kaurene oxidase P450 [Lachnellula arida]|uniref:Ent-kaurene oxidase P450 n=1 Tax=Lachnellula arida TaxID=1316785 RepID=A0A8T9B8F5_9HELO|nr:Ent-kaurene oxidase P450 [Lachnellula arida]
MATAWPREIVIPAPQEWPFSLALAVVFMLYLSSVLSVQLLGGSFPLAGVKSIFEPRILTNYRFFKNNIGVVNEGYKKFKGKAFKFARNDADMIVLPPHYIDEINELPISVANPTLAHAHNLLGQYTGMDLILRSNLHFRMIQTKLTPHLGRMTGPMQDELDYAIRQDFPEAKEWTSFEPYHVILRCVARISARAFIGLPRCRSETWLDISTNFTENIFVSVVMMRLLPTWTLPFISWVLPSLYTGKGYIRKSQKFLVDEIKHRRSLIDQGKLTGDSEEGRNLLTWMIECAEGSERDPAHLAHLEVVISLASIHTSQMNAVHVLYDLATYPEHILELRGEIEAVASEEAGWKKTSYSKLSKLDSFLRESQRVSPPSVLSLHRVMVGSHTLHDGTKLPAGSHICMATNAIQNDPSVTPNPEVFDGFRSYKKRQRDGERHMHQFATTEKNVLNFGHGKYACPGRFFASLEIKVILVRLIMDYDFKLAPGSGRPGNLRAHEFIFPNPKGELLVKRRSEKRLSPF